MQDVHVFVCKRVLERSRVSQPLNLRLCLFQHSDCSKEDSRASEDSETEAWLENAEAVSARHLGTFYICLGAGCI